MGYRLQSHPFGWVHSGPALLLNLPVNLFYPHIVLVDKLDTYNYNIKKAQAYKALSDLSLGTRH